MGLPDVSPTPKKDSMGMDYIAVYEGEDDDGSSVKMTPGKVQRLGVKTEIAKPHVVSVPVRAPGTIQLDERRVAVISLRTEAFIDTVENVTTGTMVREGQPLMRLYSPLIAGAAAEYVSILGFKSDAKSVRGVKQRLLNLAAPPSLLEDIERTREVPLTFTWTAPRSGIVLERNVVPGARVMPGDVLFRIADHTVVWALVDVAERDLGAVAEGQSVTVRVRSYPDKTFTGKVALVYPHLNGVHPHRSRAYRVAEPRLAAAARHVCRGGDRDRRDRAGPGRARGRRHRQRRSPGRHRRQGRGAVRAASGRCSAAAGRATSKSGKGSRRAMSSSPPPIS